MPNFKLLESSLRPEAWHWMIGHPTHSISEIQPSTANDLPHRGLIGNPNNEGSNKKYFPFVQPPSRSALFPPSLFFSFASLKKEPPDKSSLSETEATDSSIPVKVVSVFKLIKDPRQLPQEAYEEFLLQIGEENFKARFPQLSFDPRNRQLLAQKLREQLRFPHPFFTTYKTFILCDEKNKIMGIMTMETPCINYSDLMKHKAYLKKSGCGDLLNELIFHKKVQEISVVVHPDAFRSGVATQLLQEAYQEAQENGEKYTMMLIHADNEAARNLLCKYCKENDLEWVVVSPPAGSEHSPYVIKVNPKEPEGKQS